MEAANHHQDKPNFDIEDINNFLGDMDLFLLDLLLKGKIVEGKVLDVGFGTGRNLIHFLQRKEFEVYGIETDQSCVALLQLMTTGFDGQDPANFQTASIVESPFPLNFFQTVICSRVFHFLNDHEKALAWEQLFNMIDAGGLLYLTVNSMVNFESNSVPEAKEKFTFPDGTTGYFLTRTQLDRMINDPRFEKVEPVRNIQYDDQHAETILVLRKK